MSDINLNLYRIFYVVAQSKSYSDASEKLHLSVPSISVSVNKLENLLDTPLFYREKDGVKLTGAGYELFELVDKGLTSLDLGEKLILQKNDLENGEISIGCYSHVAKFYLMERIEKAKKDYPNLQINLINCVTSKEMFNLLEKHKIDFMLDIVPLDAAYSNRAVSKKISEIHNIFVSKDDIKINDLKELENYNFILNFNYTLTNKKLMDVLNENNISLTSTIQCDTTELRSEAAKRGLGIGYVTKEAVERELENKELFEVKVPFEFPVTEIRLVYFKEQLTKADKKFIKRYLSK